MLLLGGGGGVLELSDCEQLLAEQIISRFCGVFKIDFWKKASADGGAGPQSDDPKIGRSAECYC